jgi:uncharacterized membrane protein YbhN (UPF0104 family)
MRRWLIRAAVSGAVVVVLLSFVPLAAVMEAVARVRPWTWGAAVAIFFAGHYLNAVKLRLLLGREVHLSSCVRAQYAGLVANLGLPGLAGGDLARAAYLAPSVGMARVTWASVADRGIDTVTVLALVAIALPFAGMPPAIAAVVEQAGGWLVAVGAAIVVSAFVVLRLMAGSRAALKVRELLAAAAARRMAIAMAVSISLAVQSAFVMTNVWLARQVGVSTGLAAWFVAWPLSKLVAVLPISLGGIGVREAALVSLLAPYGAPGDAVLASGILWQGVLIVTGVVGLAVTQLLFRGQAVTTHPARVK